jgi:hypothetical protein
MAKASRISLPYLAVIGDEGFEVMDIRISALAEPARARAGDTCTLKAWARAATCHAAMPAPRPQPRVGLSSLVK